MSVIRLNYEDVCLVLGEMKKILKSGKELNSIFRIKTQRDYEKIQKYMDKGGYDKKDMVNILTNLNVADYHNTEVDDKNPEIRLHSFIKMLEGKTYIKFEIELLRSSGNKIVELISFHEAR